MSRQWLNNIRKLFVGPTPEEAYQSGKDCVDSYMQDPNSKYTRLETANYLWGLSDGAFNTKPAHDAFDKGVRDRLAELHYDCPY